MRFTLKHAALAAACIVALPAHATNGYFLPGFGFRSQGMGGVGIAYGRDSLATAANPANAVNSGMRGDLGFGVFNPERSTRISQDPTTEAVDFFSFARTTDHMESESKYFIVPEMGFSMPLTESLHIALAVVGNGGMNTTYPGNPFPGLGGPPPTPADLAFGVDMMQLLVPISLAYKVNENHALGAALVLAETRFRAYGFNTFTAFPINTDTAHLSNNGFDYSYGAGFKLGWLGEFMDDKLTVGVSYTSRTWMTKFDKYKGLFAEQGDFDVPESYGIGVAFKPAKNIVIAADLLRINYAEIASVGNPGPGLNPPGGNLGIPPMDTSAALGVCPSNPYCLGNDEGMGFGWQSMTVFKLGAQYGVNNRLLVRAGFNYGKSPIPDDQLSFNIAAPATVEKHYSVGFTYKANDMLEVTGTYMYVAPATQRACNQSIIDCVEIGMHQNVYGLSLGWVLDPSAVSLDEYGEGNWDGINFDGWYGGFGFGQSHYRDVVATTANTQTEGWKVYTGYQFNKYLGVEGGFANLNDMTAITATSRVETEAHAWDVAAVGSLPLTENFSVMARLGVAYVLTNTTTKVGAALSTRSGDDGYQPYYGVGVSYALLDNFNLRAEWERFDLDDINIDLMTAGFALEF